MLESGDSNLSDSLKMSVLGYSTMFNDVLQKQQQSSASNQQIMGLLQQCKNQNQFKQQKTSYGEEIPIIPLIIGISDQKLLEEKEVVENEVGIKKEIEEQKKIPDKLQEYEINEQVQPSDYKCNYFLNISLFDVYEIHIDLHRYEGTHYEYRVVTKMLDKEGQQRNDSVWRRFKDFELLNQYLSSQCSNILTKSLPEKESYLQNGVNLFKKDNNLIELRRQTFERCLQHLIKQNELVDDNVWDQFLHNQQHFSDYFQETKHFLLLDIQNFLIQNQQNAVFVWFQGNQVPEDLAFQYQQTNNIVIQLLSMYFVQSYSRQEELCYLKNCLIQNIKLEQKHKKFQQNQHHLYGTLVSIGSRIQQYYHKKQILCEHLDLLIFELQDYNQIFREIDKKYNQLIKVTSNKQEVKSEKKKYEDYLSVQMKTYQKHVKDLLKEQSVEINKIFLIQ